MTIETVTYISDLNSSYPANTDAMSEGDNHIRNIKTALLTTFPSVTGAVTATHTELNFVDGVTSAIQTQLDAKVDSGVLDAPSGTKMVFYQSSAPTGWTIDTTLDDSFLRVVNNSTTSWVSGVQGTDSPILMDKVPSHTHTFSETTSSNGDHSHTITTKRDVWGSCSGGTGLAHAVNAACSDWNTGTTGDHTHTISGTTSTNAGSSNWEPKYVNVIVCVKT